jgi:ribosomal protein L28
MAEKICKICGKKSSMNVTLVKLRGKFNPTSRIRKYPNLQWLKLASGKRILACAKCIKRTAKI